MLRNDDTTIKFLKNGLLFSPKNEGKKNLLFSETLLCKTTEELTFDQSFPVEVLDLEGDFVVPGFVDSHVHVLGGGGENGPSSRTPEPIISQFTEAGLTTVIGLLGTDSVTRSVENLVVKCRSLNEEGITAYLFIGSYRIPPLTITGSVQKDLMLIEQCIGVGEIAISDHRSSHPSIDELARIASEARVGGMLSGKSGKLHFHVGDSPSKLNPLWQLVEVFFN